MAKVENKNKQNPKLQQSKLKDGRAGFQNSTVRCSCFQYFSIIVRMKCAHTPYTKVTNRAMPSLIINSPDNGIVNSGLDG
ncbi:MAG: hypothetical protein LUD00_05110 [Prevotellaceae bacterium]|nr:hypothetical protein [Prevotellaceae bacterium]